MNDQYHFVGHHYFLTCKDCKHDLWKDQERKMGLCLHCLELRVRSWLARPKVLIVNPPTPNARWN